jgi:hypothetical protein
MSSNANAPTMRTVNGLTAYAFACGYLQSFCIDGTPDYYGTDADAVTLWLSGVWHIRYRVDGETTWLTFDTLTEARKAWSSIRTYLKARAKVNALTV